jgi:RNA polymerase sigma factor (TIGR02999 family)
MSEVTAILSRIDHGDHRASDELLPLVYEELRRLASRQLAHEPSGQTLQTTDLVHEAYLRLVGADVPLHDSTHFLAAAAEAMRRILVERARSKRRLKHGGGQTRIALDESLLAAGPSPDEVLMIDDLLDRLAKEHPVEAQVVKLVYFAGFNVSEAGRALSIPQRTAHRRWKFARAWLLRELRKR